MRVNGTKYDWEQLLFRRQFILGPRFAESFGTWKRLRVGPTQCLTVHPDLPTYLAQGGGKSVALLGYILDPDEPQASDADIVNGLLLHLGSREMPEDFVRLTYPFGGRWILIADNGQVPWLFNDPCGYRQVCYTHTTTHGLWCASQPGLLAEMLGFAPDQEAMNFIRTFRKRQPQYWWPVGSSPFKEVRHLLPNHYLDLKSGTEHRFWPVDDIHPRPLEEVAAESAHLLQRLIVSASHRFGLALSMTAGKDTRLLLAASKALRDMLYCYTLQYWDLNPGSPDVRVPSRLLPRLGLSHHVIRCPSRVEREFADIYGRNVTTAHQAYEPIIQGMYHQIPQNMVSMMGIAMPVTSPYLRLRLQREEPEAEREGIGPRTLARVARIPSEDFALKALDGWLSEASRRFVEGLDILSLLLWEDREGCWQAMIQLESDISHEVFVPYNCRLLLANMLSVPEQYRKKPEFVLHWTMMRHLWPDVLSEPIDPPVKLSWLSIARGFLRKPGCKNWRWLGSQIAGKWHVTEPPSETAHALEAPKSP